MSSIKGTITVINEPVQVSEKFRKQEFVINTGGTYAQDILFQLTQDKCGTLPQIGTEVEVCYNLRGRAWANPQGETKYFNTLEAWKVDVVGEVQTQEHETPPIADDLPF